MSDNVKPRRRYASARREAQAADTRRVVIAAARETFLREGWRGTTIAAVAKAAEVSAETIYARFGNKTALLRAVIETAARRTAPDTPLIEQEGPRAVLGAPDQRTAVRMFADDIAMVLSGAAELIAVARTAAETEPAMRETYQRLHRGRRANMEPLVRALMAKGRLRQGIGEADALSTIWRLTSPELFLLITRIEGTPVDAYAAWLEASLTRLLLPD